MINITKPMRIVLVEDEFSCCKEFADCDRYRDDVDIVGMTGESDMGIKMVINKLPEAVILDLDLNRGRGSGFEFLEKLAKVKLSLNPIIVVTTSNESPNIQRNLYNKHLVDFIFWKNQNDYSPDKVFNHLLNFRCPSGGKLKGDDAALQSIRSPEDIERDVKERIITTLNLFGLLPGDGREIAVQGLQILINENFTGSILRELARRRGSTDNKVSRALDRAIDYAWYNHENIDQLQKLYDAPTKPGKGPTPKQFLTYFSGKIRREMTELEK